MNPVGESEVADVAIPAATVVLVRDSATGLEVLMMRRNDRLAVHGDAWVFPGGRVEPSDVGNNECSIARAAAARETEEEVGIRIRPDELHPLSHWTTPIEFPKRFATWFFVAEFPDLQVARPDGDEAIDVAWWTPANALAAVHAGGLTLAPPQYVTLHSLQHIASVTELRLHLTKLIPEQFNPRIVRADEHSATLYHGDVMYTEAHLDLAAPGPRHRLWTRDGTWCYERDE